MTDEELSALASKGDEAASEYLIKEYKELVKSKASLYFMLGADRDDIVQEGMIGIFKAIMHYDPGKGASFRTFADLCVNRQIITAIKSAGRQKHSPLNNSLSLDKPVTEEDLSFTLGETLAAGTDTDPEEVLLMGEMAEILFSQNGSFLSDFERFVLGEMMKGKTYRDIAKENDKRDKSVDNAIQRIRRKLHLFFDEGPND
ncbi:MAG: RNA polymerase sporulation sigma factor SigH [Clostridia bacterium]|nr:RNA polymerase sporulation sigma factor SigH [Clostridia bacterium]